MSRRLGEEPFKPRQHAVLLGFTLLSALVGYSGAMLSRTGAPNTTILRILDSLASLMMLMGFIVAATGLAAWLSRVVIAQRTRSRRLSLADHRAKLAAHVARGPRRA